jgi:hypothetical protein
VHLHIGAVTFFLRVDAAREAANEVFSDESVCEMAIVAAVQQSF